MRICIITLLALSPAAIASPAVDSVNFDRLHALMQPRAQELKWQEIPWRTSLWQARIDAANAHLARFETIKKFVLVEEPLTVENGMLTPTLKAKRKKIIQRYGERLASLYAQR